MNLLISVRNSEEALLALSGGADLIDVKEPDRGALGAADRKVIEEVVSAVDGRAPVSVALGELLPEMAEQEEQSPLPSGVRFAKFGLAGCLGVSHWPDRWIEAVAQWPDETSGVLVGYADSEIAGSPRPESVIEIASQLACPVVLLDTYDKQAGNLVSLLGQERLQALCEQAHRGGLQIALAGSLSAEQVPLLAPLSPDWIAFRGAACSGGRKGKLDRRRVAALHAQLCSDPPPGPSRLSHGSVLNP